MNQDKFLDANTFDFGSSAIIKPPFENSAENMDGQASKYKRIVIDSRDRDRAIYPTPSHYVIDLEPDILEVTSAELLINEIPIQASFLIHQNNKTLNWSSGYSNPPVQQLDLQTGNCDKPSDIVDLLNESLSNNGSGIVVTLKRFTNQLVFTRESTGSGEPFAFFFNMSRSDLPLILGFDPKAYISSSTFVYGDPSDPLTPTSSTHTLVAPFRVNLLPNRYAVLTIQQFTVNNSINSVLQDSTAIISQQDMIDLRKPVTKNFNPPIARLSKLVISFDDYYGNRFDFQGQDHRLEVMLISNKKLRRY
jgi:hypothetical protein